MRSLTPAALVQMVDQLTIKAIDTIHTYIATKLRNLALHEVDQDLTSTTDNKQQTILAGTATSYLSDTGKMLGSAADTATIFEAIESMLLAMESHNKIGVAAGEAFQPVIGMHPVVLGQIRRFLRAIDSTGEYMQETVNGVVRRQLMGAPLIVSNHLEKFDTFVAASTDQGDYDSASAANSKMAYPIYGLILAEAAHYADLAHEPVIIPPAGPGANQVARLWQINLSAEFMYEITDPRYVYRVAVRAEA